MWLSMTLHWVTEYAKYLIMKCLFRLFLDYGMWSILGTIHKQNHLLCTITIQNIQEILILNFEIIALLFHKYESSGPARLISEFDTIDNCRNWNASQDGFDDWYFRTLWSSMLPLMLVAISSWVGSSILKKMRCCLWKVFDQLLRWDVFS